MSSWIQTTPDDQGRITHRRTLESGADLDAALHEFWVRLFTAGRDGWIGRSDGVEIEIHGYRSLVRGAFERPGDEEQPASVELVVPELGEEHAAVFAAWLEGYESFMREREAAENEGEIERATDDRNQDGAEALEDSEHDGDDDVDPDHPTLRYRYGIRLKTAFQDAHVQELFARMQCETGRQLYVIVSEREDATRYPRPTDVIAFETLATVEPSQIAAELRELGVIDENGPLPTTQATLTSNVYESQHRRGRIVWFDAEGFTSADAYLEVIDGYVRACDGALSLDAISLTLDPPEFDRYDGATMTLSLTIDRTDRTLEWHQSSDWYDDEFGAFLRGLIDEHVPGRFVAIPSWDTCTREFYLPDRSVARRVEELFWMMELLEPPYDEM